MDKPVAVIILNWNGKDMLRRYLPDVLATTDCGLAEVIVADNGSDDGSVGMLASEFPDVRVLSLDRNYGFAEGYNRAIAAVANRYVVLLNSDVATAKDWLRPLYDYMEQHPDAGACQPKILADADRGSFEYAGAAGGYLDANGFPYCRGRLFGDVERDMGQYDSVAELDWASGACLMVRREVYVDAGGLDASFFAHMEEIDLCWRIRRLGYRIVVVPDACVYHLGGGTLPAGNPRKTYLNFRNNLLLLSKNLPAKGRTWRLVVRRLYDTLAGAAFLAGGKWADAKAVAKAHRDFPKMRKKMSSDNNLPELDLTKGRPNIIVSYYLKGRRRFSQL